MSHFSTNSAPKPLLDAMPFTRPGTVLRAGTTIVPGSSGRFVLRMLIGIAAWIAGITASSWNTPKPA